jgi:hypothetical protein
VARYVTSYPGDLSVVHPADVLAHSRLRRWRRWLHPRRHGAAPDPQATRRGCDLVQLRSAVDDGARRLADREVDEQLRLAQGMWQLAVGVHR